MDGWMDGWMVGIEISLSLSLSTNHTPFLEREGEREKTKACPFWKSLSSKHPFASFFLLFDCIIRLLY
jgi:hypothetical protein